MSWAETFKINRDMKTPLNYLMWINELKTWGKETYVFMDPLKLVALAGDPNARLDPIISKSSLLIDGIVSANKYVGRFFAALTDSNDPVFIGLDSMQEVSNSTEAMLIILSSEHAMATLSKNATAMTEIVENAITNEKILIEILNHESVMLSMNSAAVNLQSQRAKLRTFLIGSAKFTKTTDVVYTGPAYGYSVIRTGKSIYFATKGASANVAYIVSAGWRHGGTIIASASTSSNTTNAILDAYSLGGSITSSNLTGTGICNITYDVFTLNA